MEEQNIEVLRVEISKLRLRKGDTLVVKTVNRFLMPEEMDDWHKILAKIVPEGVKWLFANKDIKFEIIRPIGKPEGGNLL